MKFLGHAYRFFSNFVFLAMVYYSLNFMEKYQQRAILALLVLVYAGMRAATTLRSFYFFQRIERLQIVIDVSMLRRGGEINAYIDLLFLAIIMLLCISKIVTN